MKRFCVYIVILIVGLSFADISYGANQIVVRSSRAKVYEKPSTRSDILYTLTKGNMVHVVGINKDGWAKVKVNLDGNFGFTGWMFKSSLGVKQEIASSKPKQDRSQRVSDLEKFFEPSEDTQTLTPRTKKKKKKSKKKAKTKSKTPPRERSSMAAIEPSWSTERLNLVFRPAWTLHDYSVRQLSGEVFSYSISGPSLSGGVHLKAPPLFQERFFASLEANGTYGLLSTKTNLRDSSGNLFGDVKAKNVLIGLNVRANLLAQVYQAPHGNVLIGPTIGYRYTFFKASDIVDDNGTRSGLFVSNQTSSVLVGLRGEMTLYPPFKLIAGMDIGLNNKFLEDPEDFSGLDALPGKLLAPYVELHFPIRRPHQFLALSYRMQYQKTDLTGDSVQDRAGQPLVDASIEQTYHHVGFAYTFQF